ncbi:MAG TPA: MarR family transcriptional regulator [Bacillota bacterium]|jgi:DNA-binding MarR family transcriptional regulator
MEFDRRATLDRFEQTLVYLARQVGVRQAKAPAEGLSVSQLIIIGWLAAGGRRRISEIASRLGVSLSAATGLADRLVKAGLAVRERSQEDRRVVWVEITESGRKLLEYTRDGRRRHLDHAFSVVNDEELWTVTRVMDKIADHLRREPTE